MADDFVVSTRVDAGGRRRYTIAEKEQIVEEFLAADGQTGRGVVLRRWGTFQQNVYRWRKQIDEGTLGKKRKEPAGKNMDKVRVRELEAQLEKARGKIGMLSELVEAQGKALGLHAKTVDSQEII